MDFTEAKPVLVETKQHRLQNPHHTIFAFGYIPQPNFSIVFMYLYLCFQQEKDIYWSIKNYYEMLLKA